MSDIDNEIARAMCGPPSAEDNREPLTDEQLAEMEQLLRRAVPGPWRLVERKYDRPRWPAIESANPECEGQPITAEVWGRTNMGGPGTDHGYGGEEGDTGLFIAKSWSTVDKLLGEARRLRAENERLIKDNSDVRKERTIYANDLQAERERLDWTLECLNDSPRRSVTIRREEIDGVLEYRRNRDAAIDAERDAE